MLQAEYSRWFRENKVFLGPLDRYKYIDKGGVYTGSQSVHNPGKEGYRYDVMHPRTGKPCKQPLLGYRFPKATMDEMLKNQEILFGDDEEKIIELKVYAKDYEEKLSSVYELDGRLGPYDLKELFPELKKAFTNPKPVALIEHFASFALGPDDTVLDFFSGSGTTAHAVMSLNAKDSGRRRFVLVQLDEAPDPKSDALKAGYSTISQVCRERIRRAGSKIVTELTARRGAENQSQPDLLTSSSPQQLSLPDVGFRVLKIDTSNMKDVYYAPDAVKQADLLAHLDNIREERTPEDLLFQVLVDWGVDLTLPIATETLAGKTVVFVDGSALAACFDADITEDLVKELAKRKPLRAVFRDSSYGSDSVKINVEQIFKLLSPGTEIKSL
jgi:adenine-specific DNA-methyltransferase